MKFHVTEPMSGVTLTPLRPEPNLGQLLSFYLKEMCFCDDSVTGIPAAKNIKDSLDAPRIHHNLWPMAVQVEPDVDDEITKYLRRIGHGVTDWRIMQNTLAAIAVNSATGIDASGDYRREGGTDGY